MPNHRRQVLFGVLALTVLAAVQVSEPPEGEIDALVAPAVERVAARRQVPAKELSGSDRVVLHLDKLQRNPMEVGDLNPFGARSWYVAPPPPPPPPPPPAEPAAPPLPFTYVGQLQEIDGRWVVYLSKGEEAYAVSKGDTFDSVYRLEGVENGNVVIQYLPLSVRQLLPINGES